MTTNRIDRLNSLLKEVISEVIREDVKNPHVSNLITITRVDISKDIRHAKVYVSVIGDEAQRIESINALNSAAGFIAVRASKKIVIRFFPDLVFKLDDSADKHHRIETLLNELSKEKKERPDV